ncbi:uncharacterized protein DUF397 [Herbihabitans rhizosphaerae]|uniref:Uncharacterized protein DUF397 n=1 Tax=Herbihabitans rhizosphaerae TaxID=1872711 RepID=A0A4Q7KUR0_9PSEU|nr:DUF397 domain-containing protein [Herbihabitans rhizosphaerae]RZS40738.1 uncharacterized protein DUF397 [Herbihabitans rhizosphaerae]
MPTVDTSGLAWRKSSRSGADEQVSCVEVAFAGAAVAVRDSKNPCGPTLFFPTSGFAAVTPQLDQRSS